MLVFQRDIDRDGKYLENNDKYCTDVCRKFITRKCNGAVLIRQGTDDYWRYRKSYGFKNES